MKSFYRFSFLFAMVMLLGTAVIAGSALAQTSSNTAAGFTIGLEFETPHPLQWLEESDTMPFNLVLDDNKFKPPVYVSRLYANVHYDVNNLRDVESMSDSFATDILFESDTVRLSATKVRMTTTIEGRCRDGMTARFDSYYDGLSLVVNGVTIDLPAKPTVNQRVDFSGGIIVLNRQYVYGDAKDSLLAGGRAFTLDIPGHVWIEAATVGARVECQGTPVKLLSFSIE